MLMAFLFTFRNFKTNCSLCLEMLLTASTELQKLLQKKKAAP